MEKEKLLNFFFTNLFLNIEYTTVSIFTPGVT